MRMFVLAALMLLCAAAASGGALAQDVQDTARQRPVVVELYTSQGCSACPRANRLVAQFARDEGVVALTFPVGYWDYLGWADTFAQPQFSDRQRDYERALRFHGPFTPQLIIGGVRQVRAADWDEARATLDEVRALPPAAGAPHVSIVRLDNGKVRVSISGEAPRATPADIWLMSYDPGPLAVWIASGDNANRTVVHYNLVRWMWRAGEWTGAQTWFERPRCVPQCAVIVQEPDGGAILGAAMTRREPRQ